MYTTYNYVKSIYSIKCIWFIYMVIPSKTEQFSIMPNCDQAIILLITQGLWAFQKSLNKELQNSK